MSIPASTSFVPQVVYAVGSQISLENIFAASNGLEAGFYSMLKGGVQQTSRLVIWIRDTSVAHINTIQALFNIASVGMILLCTVKLLVEVQGRFSVVENPSIWSLTSIPIIFAVGGVVALFMRLINDLSPSHMEGQVVEGVEITESSSRQQKIGKVLQTTKLVLNIALVCFAKKPFWFLISAGATGYSLLKNTNIKWMNLSTTFPYVSHNPEVPATHLKATYNILQLPPDQLALKEKCAICSVEGFDDDDEELVDMAFCANHVFHRNCVLELAKTKANSFIDDAFVKKITTRHYQNGIYTHTSYSYSIRVPEENFPTCPQCREIPLQNSCDIQVTDSVHGQFNAAVTIQRPPVDRNYLFENLYAVYNMAQAGLTYLQTYPELAAAVFKIQQVMLVTDFIGYAFTAYYLVGKVNAKFNPQNSRAFKFASIAALIAAAVLSYFAVMQINAYLRSALILKDILAQLKISPDILKTISVSWDSPFIHQVMQVLYLNRIAAIAALSFFSAQRKTNLLSAAATFASFTGISSLKWLEVTQTLAFPLQKVIANGGELLGNLHEQSLKSLQMTSNFLVNRSCSVNPENLKKTLETICTYTNKFFNNSSWYRYWNVSYYNGIETGRQIYYSIWLKDNPLGLSLGALTSALVDYKIKLVDSFYGAAGVTIG